MTFDLDFGERAARHQNLSPGVVVFSMCNTRITHVIERFEHVLAESSTALAEGAVIVVEESRHRIRFFTVNE